MKPLLSPRRRGVTGPIISSHHGVSGLSKSVGNSYSEGGQFFLGPEIVVNGDFNSSSSWLFGSAWTVGGGFAETDGSQSAITSLAQIATFIPTRIYRIQFSIIEIDGNMLIVLGDDSVSEAMTQPGNYTIDMVFNVGTTFAILVDIGVISKFGFISIKEILIG